MHDRQDRNPHSLLQTNTRHHCVSSPCTRCVALPPRNVTPRDVGTPRAPVAIAPVTILVFNLQVDSSMGRGWRLTYDTCLTLEHGRFARVVIDILSGTANLQEVCDAVVECAICCNAQQLDGRGWLSVLWHWCTWLLSASSGDAIIWHVIRQVMTQDARFVSFQHVIQHVMTQDLHVIRHVMAQDMHVIRHVMTKDPQQLANMA